MKVQEKKNIALLDLILSKYKIFTSGNNVGDNNNTKKYFKHFFVVNFTFDIVKLSQKKYISYSVFTIACGYNIK